MATFLLILFSIECLVILCWGIIRRDRLIQLPFLASAVFLGWMLPQLIGLSSDPFLPKGGLEKTTFMAMLCLAALWVGYVINKQPSKLFWWQLDRQRLFWCSVVLSLLGAFFFYLVSTLAIDVIAEVGGNWTGPITIFMFFAELLTVGLVVALVLHLNKPSWPTFLVIMFDLIFYLDRIIIKGRRAAMLELGLIVLIALWFHRRWLPPRWAMGMVLLIGALVINSIGEYRNILLGKDRWNWSGAGISEVVKIDYVGNYLDMIDGKSPNYELTNAIVNIDATDRKLLFDFGLSHWNKLVFRYIPAQLVGKDVKQAMMNGYADFVKASNSAATDIAYIHKIGTTATGLTDSFQSFWYFGAINFFLIGLIMSRWYIAASQGNIVAQMILMLTITPALHGITHSTHWFFVFFIQMAAFLLPLLLIARNIPHKPALLCVTSTQNQPLSLSR